MIQETRTAGLWDDRRDFQAMALELICAKLTTVQAPSKSIQVNYCGLMPELSRLLAAIFS